MQKIKRMSIFLIVKDFKQTLKILKNPEIYAKLEENSKMLEDGLLQAAEKAKVTETAKKTQEEVQKTKDNINKTKQDLKNILTQ